jgi:hypothetical protein
LNRDEIVQEFQALGFFANVQEVAGLIGNNVSRLRKLSQVKNSAYYRDEKYLKALKEVNDAEKWGLEYDGHGLLVANEQTIDNQPVASHRSRVIADVENRKTQL